jgi:hypothetical protein
MRLTAWQSSEGSASGTSVTVSTPLCSTSLEASIAAATAALDDVDAQRAALAALAAEIPSASGPAGSHDAELLRLVVLLSASPTLAPWALKAANTHIEDATVVTPALLLLHCAALGMDLAVRGERLGGVVPLVARALRQHGGVEEVAVAGLRCLVQVAAALTVWPHVGAIEVRFQKKKNSVCVFRGEC